MLTKKRRVTSKGKSTTCSKPIPAIPSSQTSGRDSTSNEKVCKPFWNECTKEWSRKLWCATKTDCVDMDLNSWSGLWKRQARGSWYSVRLAANKTTLPASWPMTCLQLQQSLWQGTTEGDRQKTVDVVSKLSNQNKHVPGHQLLPADHSLQKKQDESSTYRMRKVRVYPTANQRDLLKRWIGTARWTYNQAVTKLRTKACKPSMKSLRASVLNASALENIDCQWALDTPYDVRDEAMKDVLKAIRANVAAKRERFYLKFRSRKAPQQSVVIHKKHWNRKRGAYSQLFAPRALRSPEVLPEELDCDSRLVRTRLGHWYLCLPTNVDTRVHKAGRAYNKTPSHIEIEYSSASEATSSSRDNQAEHSDCCQHREEVQAGVVSLDPGVRTFMTAYDPDGRVFEWGPGDFARIERLCMSADRLQSRWMQKTVRHRKRYKLQRAARRVRLKIRRLVDEMHKKFAKWLCENYQTILLPKFESSRMVRCGKRNISSRSARAMLTWSHYRFRQRLLDKVVLYGSDRRVIVCDEAYTSKMCGQCGYINRKLGAGKTFTCPACRSCIDRDVNGARNVLLRFLTLTNDDRHNSNSHVFAC